MLAANAEKKQNIKDNIRRLEEKKREKKKESAQKQVGQLYRITNKRQRSKRRSLKNFSLGEHERLSFNES